MTRTNELLSTQRHHYRLHQQQQQQPTLFRQRFILGLLGLSCLGGCRVSAAVNAADDDSRSAPSSSSVVGLESAIEREISRSGDSNERPLTFAGGGDTAEFDRFYAPENFPSSSDENVMTSRLHHRGPSGGGSRRHPPSESPWPPDTSASSIRSRDNSGDRHSKTSARRRKKLKSSVFYAVRGRRGDSVDQEEDSTTKIDNDDEWRPQPVGGGNNRMLINAAAAAGRGSTNRRMNLMSIEKALTMMDEDGTDRKDPGRWRTRSKDKRNPPTGFHAIRGKRSL